MKMSMKMIPDDCSLLLHLCSEKEETSVQNVNTINDNVLPLLMTFVTTFVLAFFLTVVKPSNRSQCSHSLMSGGIMAGFLTLICALLYSKAS